MRVDDGKNAFQVIKRLKRDDDQMSELSYSKFKNFFFLKTNLIFL